MKLLEVAKLIEARLSLETGENAICSALLPDLRAAIAEAEAQNAGALCGMALQDARAAIAKAEAPKRAIKTMSGWNKSGLNLSQYLQIGDIVDDELVDYFVGVLPPACWSDKCIQIGEPVRYNSFYDAPEFATLMKVKENWVYAGEKVTPRSEVCLYRD